MAYCPGGFYQACNGRTFSASCMGQAVEEEMELMVQTGEAEE
jgi:hypothetical protein